MRTYVDYFESWLIFKHGDETLISVDRQDFDLALANAFSQGDHIEIEGSYYRVVRCVKSPWVSGNSFIIKYTIELVYANDYPPKKYRQDEWGNTK